MKNWAPAGFVTCAAFAILAFDYLKQTQLVRETLPNVEISLGLSEYLTSLGVRAQAVLKGEEDDDVAETPAKRLEKYQMLGAVAAGIANTASSDGGEELLYAVAATAKGSRAGGPSTSVSMDAIGQVAAAAQTHAHQTPAQNLERLAAQVTRVANGTKLPEHQHLAEALQTLSTNMDAVDTENGAQMLARVGDMAHLALVHDGGETALIEELAAMSHMDPSQVAAMAASYSQLPGADGAVPGSRDVARSYLSDSLAGGTESGARSVRCTLVNGSRRCRIVYDKPDVTQ